MKGVIKIIINVLHITSFVGLAFSGLIGTIFELVGWGIIERIFSKIGISRVFELCMIIGTISLTILIVTYFIKTKIN